MANYFDNLRGGHRLGGGYGVQSGPIDQPNAPQSGRLPNGRAAAPGAPAPRAGGRSAAASAAPACHKDSCFRIALSCTPIIGSFLMQPINELESKERCQKVRFDSPRLAEEIEHKNRYKKYAIISYAIPLALMVTLVALSIMSVWGAIFPLLIGGLAIAFNAYMINRNQESIAALRTNAIPVNGVPIY